MQYIVITQKGKKRRNRNTSLLSLKLLHMKLTHKEEIISVLKEYIYIRILVTTHHFHKTFSFPICNAFTDSSTQNKIGILITYRASRSRDTYLSESKKRYVPSSFFSDNSLALISTRHVDGSKLEYRFARSFTQGCPSFRFQNENDPDEVCFAFSPLDYNARRATGNEH